MFPDQPVRIWHQIGYHVLTISHNAELEAMAIEP